MNSIVLVLSLYDVCISGTDTNILFGWVMVESGGSLVLAGSVTGERMGAGFGGRCPICHWQTGLGQTHPFEL
jgi:hypothetical protein